MKGSDLVAAVVELSGCNKKQVAKMLNALALTASQNLKNPGDTLALTGLGKLKVVERQARQEVDPETNATTDIPGGLILRFRPDKGLQEGLGKGPGQE